MTTAQQCWSPSADLLTLKRRAQLMADVRLFFAQRQEMEVDTPIMSAAAPTAPYLESFATDYIRTDGEHCRYYLHTSPEFAMKRLLAAGSGDIYQIARVFRNGEQGRYHGPEFVMLEWYRPALNYHGLMAEVDDLLGTLAAMPAAVKYRYHELFQQYLGIDIDMADSASLKRYALAAIPALPADWHSDYDDWLALLMSELIEPQLAQLNKPVIIYDFPASQAQLAKTYQNEVGRQVAARFEVYAGGLELANGYDECQDANELRRRFAADNQRRFQQNKQQMPIDEHLLAAMEAGLPACTGVALGLDRLLMLITQAKTIAQVQSFAFERS